MVIVAVCLLLAGGALAYISYRYHQVHKVAVAGLDSPAPTGSENILLVGDNSRCALKKYSTFYQANDSHFGTCSTVGGGRSDVVMVLHLDPANHSATVLSLPRDLWLPMPDGNGLELRVDDALNSAETPYLHLPFGPSLLVKTVEEDLGIPIAHYVELNFYTFEQVVNVLGGVNLDFPTELKDAYSGLRITSTGCQHLDGTQALALVRARHLYYKNNGVWDYDGTGDLGRIKRTHIFLRVLASEVEHRALGNPLTANALLGSVLPDLKVDQSFSLSDLLHLVLEFHSVNAASVPTDTLPVIIDDAPYHDLSNPSNYQAPGEVVFPFQPEDQTVIDQTMGKTVTEDAATEPPSSVTVSVLNGTGKYGQASQTASALQALGYNVAGTGASTPGGDPSETVVRYAPGDIGEAEHLLSQISGEAIMGEGGTTDGADLTVVTGSAFSIAAPATSTTTPGSSSTTSTGTSQGTTVPSTSTNTSTGTTAGSSSTVSQLAANDLWNEHHSSKEFWWDPTACPS